MARLTDFGWAVVSGKTILMNTVRPSRTAAIQAFAGEGAPASGPQSWPWFRARGVRCVRVAVATADV